MDYTGVAGAGLLDDGIGPRPFEQHQDGELQPLAALGAQSRIGAGIDLFGKPGRRTPRTFGYDPLS